MRQSGKVKVLFWLFLFSLTLFLWIVWIAMQTFLFDGPKRDLTDEYIVLLFVLYIIMVLFVLAGTIVSIFINNRRYMNRFGIMTLVIFLSFLIGKSIFG